MVFGGNLNENCLVCMFSWSLFATILSSSTCFTFVCDHERVVSRFEFKISKKYCSLSVLCGLIVCLYTIQDLWTTFGKNEEFLNVIVAVTRNLPRVKCVILIVCNISRAEYRMKAFIIQMDCIQRRSLPYIHGEDCFSLSTSRRLKRVSQIYLVVSFLLILTKTCIAILLVGHSGFSLLVDVFCFYVELSTLIVFVMTTTIYQNILKFLLETLKVTLSDVSIHLINVNPKEINHSIMELRLKQLSLLYFRLYESYWFLTTFSHPSVLLWFLISLVTMIFNVFITINALCFNFVNLLDPTVVGLQVQIYISCVITMLAIRMVEKLRNMGEEIQSFLFRYPISKLSQGEAAQVEMLITTLNIQKPVLKASDMFTMGTRLIASIIGTVVTYVLVALQFQASWSKN